MFRKSQTRQRQSTKLDALVQPEINTIKNTYVVHSAPNSREAMCDRGLIDRLPYGTTANVTQLLFRVDSYAIEISGQVNDETTLGRGRSGGVVTSTLDGNRQLGFFSILDSERYVFCILDERHDGGFPGCILGPPRDSLVEVSVARSYNVTFESSLERGQIHSHFCETLICSSVPSGVIRYEYCGDPYAVGAIPQYLTGVWVVMEA